MVQGGGFEPPKLSRQIYSLIHLATLEPLRKADTSAINIHESLFQKLLQTLTKMELAIGVEPTTC